MLRAAALRGLGLVDLPNFLIGGDIEAGTLVPVLQDYVHQEGAIYAVYPHARYLPPKIRVFIDFLAERWGGAAEWPDMLP
jgi:DNA-binding transcriptional LysR family regulator